MQSSCWIIIDFSHTRIDYGVGLGSNQPRAWSQQSVNETEGVDYEDEDSLIAVEKTTNASNVGFFMSAFHNHGCCALPIYAMPCTLAGARTFSRLC